MNRLYILPFDHRSSFSKMILGTENPNKEQGAKLKEFKQIIFNGMIKSLKERKDKKSFAILVDEEYGKDVLLKAKEEKVKICLPIEKSGEELLKLQYGKKFAEHISKFAPDYVKILIRYNPGNSKQNLKQLAVLEEINTYCKNEKIKTIIELLVPATEQDLINCKDKESYDKILRPQLTAQAIREIKKIMKPNIWKLEGFGKKDWLTILPETKGSKIILLGRGEDDTKVKNWLKSASAYDDMIGFAIGRTIFLTAIKEYHDGIISKEQASDKIAKKFLSFVNNWEKYATKES